MRMPKIKFKTLWPQDKSGTAAIEFGLFVPLLLIMVVGTVELGFSMYQAMQVNNAVESGALYAMNQTTFNAANIGAAVVAASGATGLTATPAPTQFCGCAATAGITVSGNCSTACSNGNAPGTYIQVNASIPHTTILANSFGLPATFTAISIVRVD
jgi:Flp pilus assembly protein TadG